MSGYTTTIDENYLRELFLQRLPGNVQMVLATVFTMDLYGLASLADKVLEVAILSVCNVTSSFNNASAAPQTPSDPASPIDALYDCLEQLQKGLCRLKPELYRCILTWRDERCLLVGWADRVKVCCIRHRDPSQSTLAEDKGQPKQDSSPRNSADIYVEIGTAAVIFACFSQKNRHVGQHVTFSRHHADTARKSLASVAQNL
ncbi:hypothetical protein HPB51_008947 [Rhipicephalus microplus]|uniref:Uncharacterized protein n=1 Tax=Rhipicephalus microplus TaxID=6941 RepID=A0A9J6D4M3_RHIMP|nr:hypothetical protein HPB51_008947 [Rhipicephalus microplus]